MFPEPGTHQARPRPLLPRRRGVDHAHGAGPPDAAAAVPERSGRVVVLPEADPRLGAAVAADHHRQRPPNGTTSRAIVMADIAHVLWAANLGCLGFHPWPCRAGDPENTDELRIDLDPGPGVTYAMVQEAAAETFDLLATHGIRSYSRRPATAACTCTCGWSRGGTLSAPARRPSRVARELAERRPDLITGELVEGGARAAGVRRLQPERAAQDGVRGVVRAGPPGRAGVDAVRWDELADDPSRRADDGDRAAAARGARRPVGDDGRRAASIEPLVERYERDLAAGIPDAPWPPVYPKMPDEAPRVTRAAPANRTSAAPSGFCVREHDARRRVS